MVVELGEDWNDVISNERISVVKCYATWCGPCKFYSSHFKKFSENYEVYNDTEIKYYQANSDILKDLSEKYKVDRLPTTMILVHGALVYKIQGITRSSVFEEALDKALKIKFTVERK